MSKTIKYAEIAAWVAGIGNAIVDINEQMNAMKLHPEAKFDWKRMSKAFGKGALLGGAGGALIGGMADYNNTLTKPIKTDSYLNNLSQKIRLNKKSSKYLLVNDKAEFLSQLLGKRFRNKLVNPPERLGSTEKGTALQQKFDIDVGLKFLHYSFSTTEKMRFSVLKFLEGKKGKYGVIEVREQRASIGVVFSVEGQKFKIDVVPIKITEGNRHSGYLSVTKPSMFSWRYSHQKTNIKVLKSIRLSETQKRIVLLLKHWKEKYDVPMGSHLLENLVLDAYAYSPNVPKGFTRKVIMVLEHIANNLEVAVIRGQENSNNFITNIDPEKKQQIISACRKVVNEYKYQPNTIKNMF